MTRQGTFHPTSAVDRYSRKDVRLLRQLASADARLVADTGETETRYRVLKGEGEGTLAKPSAITRQDVTRMLASGLLRVSTKTSASSLNGGSASEIRLSGAGRNTLRRLLSEGESAFADQHRILVREAPKPEPDHRDAKAYAKKPAKPREDDLQTINLRESPLAWLARRRDKKGSRLLEPDMVKAGERLREDYSFARLMPSMGSSWRTGDLPGASRHRGTMADLSDDVIAARQRLERLMHGFEPVLAGVLLDVCCHLKGLETVEAERGWPARSAKVVLKIALGALADRYGYRTQAPFGSGRILSS